MTIGSFGQPAVVAVNAHTMMMITGFLGCGEMETLVDREAPNRLSHLTMRLFGASVEFEFLGAIANSPLALAPLLLADASDEP